jgi:8-oxo-dGTP pyrophosphatase MutT (NUDIX family)
VVLSRRDIERRLKSTCPPVDIERLFLEPGTPAAVLIGIVGRAGGPNIILTRRQAHLKNHAAEIGLPGGRVEVTDTGPESTALREAFEEIGLRPDRVELLGCLAARMTVSDFRVYPFVGWVKVPVKLVVDQQEVAEVFEVPLTFVMDRANHKRDSALLGGVDQEFYVIEHQGHRIWGATAEILVDLARALA